MLDLGTGLLGILSVRKLLEAQFDMPEPPQVELPKLCDEKIRPTRLSRLIKIINR